MESAPFKTIRVGNLGSHLTVEHVQDLLKVTPQDKTTEGFSLDLDSNDDDNDRRGNYAIVTAPDERVAEFLKLNGTEFMGKNVTVETVGSEGTPNNAQSSVMDVDQPNSGNSFSAVAGNQNFTTYEFVEIDATMYCDPYNLPRSSDICLAITNTFGDDPDRNVFGAGRNRAGVYRLETPMISLYRGVTELKLNETLPPIASVTIKTEKINLRDDGSIQRKNIRSPNDLLLTFKDADKYIFSNVSNVDILTKVISFGVGRVKKSVQRQFDSKKGEYTGNKFCVLEDVQPGDRNKIPDHIMFVHPIVGNIKMWVQHRHQVRRCWFCGEKHAAGCKIKEKVEALEKERESKREQEGIKIKTYASSVMRYANQAALVSDIDAMSGATTGNLLNAVEVDVKNTAVPNLVIVGGLNEMRMRVSMEEYVFSLKVIRQRLAHLNQTRRVLFVPPPAQPGMFPEDAVKREFFDVHLGDIEAQGIVVVKNPVDTYGEDQGSHPSPSQTTEIVKHIDQSSKLRLGTPYLMENATDDVISLPNFYHHVTSLYKYGCAACGAKDRNKWPNICDHCKSQARSDEEVLEIAKKLEDEVRKRTDAEHPPIGGVSDDSTEEGFKCDDCGVVFEEIGEMRNHFKDSHPSADFRYKRVRRLRAKESETKGGRRTKGAPTKSLDG